MRKADYENKNIKRIELVYVGEGKELPNVPRKDLSPEEVKQYGGEEYLISTGLYITPYEAYLDGGIKWHKE